jgi:hypothetical protein
MRPFYTEKPRHIVYVTENFIPIEQVEVFFTYAAKFTLHLSMTRISPYIPYVTGLQIVTAMSMKMIDFWDVVPCSLAKVCRRFTGV